MDEDAPSRHIFQPRIITVSKSKGLSQDIKGNVALVGLDQMGSRWLQSQLDDTRLSGAKMIVGEVLESALLLSRDVFGNYIVQKTLEYVDQENKDAIGRAVKGRMRRLSFDVDTSLATLFLWKGV